MDIQLEDISSVSKKLSFTVPADKVDEELNNAYRTLKREVVLPGFRPGRVPRKLLEQRFGTQIRGEVSSKLIGDAFDKAVEDHDLSPVAQPDVDEGDLELGKAFAFTITVDVKPDLELKDYNGVKVVWDRDEVNDDEVNEQIESMQRQSGSLVAVDEERPVADGDVVTVNLKMTSEGLEDYDREGMMLSLPDDPYFGFAVDLARGATVGKTVEGEITVPADFIDADWAGKTCAASIEVTEMKKLEHRELDDQFAKDMGHDSVDVMNAAIRFSIQEAKDKRARDEASRRLVAKIIAANPFEVPTKLVEHRGQSLVSSIAQQMMPGFDQANMFSLDDLDEERRANILEEADFSVRRELVLEAVTKAEEIAVTDDEIDGKITSLAEETGQRAETLRGYLLKGGGMDELKERMLQDKALDLLLERAEIVDEDDDEEPVAPKAADEPEADEPEADEPKADEPKAEAEEPAEPVADSVSSDDDSVSSDDDSSDDEG
jgi:trigger factor